MKNVLLIATVRPEWAKIRSFANEFHELGIAVRLAGPFPVDALRTTSIDARRTLRMDLSGRRGGRAPKRYSIRWWLFGARRALIHQRLKWSPAMVRTAVMVRHDPWVQREAARADALVALDNDAVLAVRSLARRYPDCRAVRSVDALIRPLRERQEAVTTLGSARRFGLRDVTPDQLLAAWESFLSDPRGPAFEPVWNGLPQLVQRLRRSAALDLAAQIADQSLQLPMDDELRDWLRFEHTTTKVARLEPPTFDLTAAAGAVLAHADRRLAAVDLPRVTDLMVAVEEGLFQRELHADVERSPLVDEPESFLRPLHASAAYRTLTGAMNPIGRAAPARRSAGAGRRILVLSSGNMHFANGIVSDLRSGSECEVRELDLSVSAERFGRWWPWALTRDRLDQARGTEMAPLPGPQASTLAWPDTVVVDWCDHAAVWASIRFPRAVRLVVRVHSIEALSQYPQMMDWSRVSDVIFVGRHIRDYLLRAAPSLSRVGAIHVLPNEMRVERFALPKRDGAARTVAMVSWGQRVKDPLFALDVLAKLRAQDPSWRMLLLGNDFAERQTRSGASYVSEFRRRMTDPDLSRSVIFGGYSDDLPEALRDAGFILNTSRRESFAVGVFEGAASGAVPVVRNWPLFASYDGARGVLPADWVVEDASAAAERIIAHADDEVRRRGGESARRHVVENYDWSVVRQQYRDVILA